MATEHGASVDLTNCDREPIHQIGAVQPFGFLVAVSSRTWRVIAASRNTGEWIGATPEELNGKPIDTVFTPGTIHLIRTQLHGATGGDATVRICGVVINEAGLKCDLAVHVVDEAVVIECERSVEEPNVNASMMLRGMLGRLQEADGMADIYRVAARGMRALTGFNRVMIYRFEHDGSGEVVAESARAGLESFLGLHYPASDIPRQARILYERNWLRIIPDITATPSPIDPPTTESGAPFDLSLSTLRSVSPIHIEYLTNMGVAASMSVSILRKGRLWGLFACHHYAPHYVAFERRTAAELFGQHFSLLVENRERAEDAEYEERAQALHNLVVTTMASEAAPLSSIVHQIDGISELLACDGVGIWSDGKATLRGLTPDPKQFAGLVGHLVEAQIGEVHATAEIAAEYPPARAFADHAAGMLAVPLSRPPRDYLVFFRKEYSHEVKWAGDPNKPITVGPLGARLTPRKSFELWKETRRGQSLPWTPVELRIVESLRVSLLEVILRLSDLTASERRDALERRELLIAELNHRVRNILGLIRGVVTQSRDAATSVEMFAEVIGGRILALARAHDQITEQRWGPGSLRRLIAAETGAYIAGKADRIVVSGPDVLIEPSAFTTIALVIHEMMTNSAKYGSLSDSRGRVEIGTAFDEDGHLVLNWGEHDGPPVAPPTRRGFGSTVVERSIVHDLSGEARLDFLRGGLRAVFVIPRSFVQLSEADEPEAVDVPEAPSPQAGSLPQDVLLVEDNMIIALDTEEMVRRAGIRDVRTAGNVARALQAIEERAPDFALLDVNLGSEETSFPVAERLLALGIPFAFATGYGEPTVFSAELADIPRLRKPYSEESLRAILSRPAET